jgi:hypothetical protein
MRIEELKSAPTANSSHFLFSHLLFLSLSFSAVVLIRLTPCPVRMHRQKSTRSLWRPFCLLSAAFVLF